MKSNAKIAIIGLGRAGQARHRSFSKLVGDKLIVLSSRRQSQSPQFDDIRTNPDIAAVVLSRESQRHATDAQAMLEAGKHVLVEYPLAYTAEEAQRLFRCAAAHRRVLHVGYLGLQQGWAGEVKQRMAHADIRFAHYQFNAGYGHVPQGDVGAQRLGTMVLARLQQLQVWFGDLELTACGLERFEDGIEVNVSLSGKSQSGDCLIEFVESRREGQTRERFLTVKNSSRDAFRLPSWYPDRTVFDTDSACFHQRCLGHPTPDYVSEDAVIAVMTLADRISDALEKQSVI
ncbi:MAG: Gfo/Idh/MocA family oxidoreductase [Bradymonadia bacterium]